MIICIEFVSSAFEAFGQATHKVEGGEEKKRWPRISVIEMPVRLTLGIIPFGHNNSGARLLTPLGVGTIITRRTKVTLGI
jgi:hypothetical protein